MSGAWRPSVAEVRRVRSRALVGFVGPRGERSDKLSVIASVLPNDVG